MNPRLKTPAMRMSVSLGLRPSRGIASVRCGVSTRWCSASAASSSSIRETTRMSGSKYAMPSPSSCSRSMCRSSQGLTAVENSSTS